MKLVKSFETLNALRVEVDPVEALLDYQVASMNLDEAIDEIQGAVQSFETYSEIVSCIEKCGGVSKSLEILFGENFSSAAAMQEEASKEAFQWLEDTWEAIKRFFVNLWAWFKSLFTSTATMKEKLEELMSRDDVKYPIEVPAAWGEGKAQVKKAILDKFKKFIALFRETATNKTGVAFYGSPETSDPTGDSLKGFQELVEKNAAEIDGLYDACMKKGNIETVKISNKAELGTYCGSLIAQIDESKNIETEFKGAEEAFNAVFKTKADLNEKGKKAFIILQKVTTKLGKFAKSYGNSAVRQGHVLITKVKKEKAAAPAAEPAKPEEKK